MGYELKIGSGQTLELDNSPKLVQFRAFVCYDSCHFHQLDHYVFVIARGEDKI